jgi:hypothetical protein
VSFSYDEELTDDLSKARHVLGDTDSTAPLLSDETIEAVIGMYTPLAIGIAFLADGLAAKHARKPTSVGLPSGLRAEWAERVKYWRDKAIELRATGSLTGAATAFSVAPVRTDGYSAYADETA